MRKHAPVWRRRTGRARSGRWQVRKVWRPAAAGAAAGARDVPAEEEVLRAATAYWGGASGARARWGLDIRAFECPRRVGELFRWWNGASVPYF